MGFQTVARFFRRWACVLAMPLMSVSASADIIGVSWDFGSSPVHRIDEGTGAGVLVGLSGFSRLNSLARDGSGVLYSVGGSQWNTLVTVDPVTGAGTVAATLSSSDIRGLGFSGGVLFAIRDGFADDLVTINVTTGVVTVVGSTGVFGLQGLAVSPDGTLYGWEVGTGSGFGLGLVTINPLTGAVTDVNAAIGGFADDIQGLAFGPDGLLYGARESLFTVHLATGALTLVGSGGYSDVRGIEFTGGPTAVPEPSILTLLGLAAIGLAWRRVAANR